MKLNEHPNLLLLASLIPCITAFSLAPIVATAEETGGNCLSVPVIWVEGSKSLPGTFGTPTFGGAYWTDELDVKWYLQQDPSNLWQAESFTWEEADPPVIDEIDWGDNLEAKEWTTHSIVRVETTLYEYVASPMLAFTMTWISGQGIDEMWGTNTDTFDNYSPTVYTPAAQLTIQKLLPDATDLTWSGNRWTGDVDIFILPLEYSAEINVKGKIIYGYNWSVRNDGDGEGVYRITMHFSNSPIDFVDGTTKITLSEETVVLPTAGDDGGEPVGGTAQIDFTNDLTYIDVAIVQGGGSGNGGGGNGNKGDGGGGGPKGPRR